MKRSEARKLVKQAIEESILAKAWSRGFKDGTVSWEEFSDVLAEVALMAAEVEVGMLPPMQKISRYAFQAPNEWEPEDE